MALDTRNKRSSAINVSSPWRGMLPVPDGSLDQGDRQQVGLHYRGILSASPSGAVTSGGEYIVMYRRRRRSCS
jgi:hypothetical protein